MNPLALDLCCGLGGWTHALLDEGWDVIGYDIERHEYGEDKYPGTLILQDVRTIDGAQFRGKVSLVVASPPCVEYSYMAMPWGRAKQIRSALLGKSEFPKGYKGSKSITELNELFNACVRIAHEAGCPIIIENVRGAQEWIGRSKANFGSFHLWGDVPALMPIPAKFWKTPEGSWDTTRKNYNPDHTWKGEGTKLPGNNAPRRWEDREVKRLCDAGVKVESTTGRRTDIGNGTRFTSRDCGNEGTKQFKDFHDSPIAALGSKSKARKKASAEIAKIPKPLALWIARCFKPKLNTP